MILTLTGASRVGKSSIFRYLQRNSITFLLVSSHTTRKPRPDDIEDEYIYHTDEEFERVKGEVEYLWDFEIEDNKYLTTKESVLRAQRFPKMIFGMILSPSGIRILKNFAREQDPKIQVVSIYIFSPSEEELRKRIGDKRESSEMVEKRIKLGREWDKEASSSGLYEYFITGGKCREEAISKVTRILAENRP